MCATPHKECDRIDGSQITRRVNQLLNLARKIDTKSIKMLANDNLYKFNNLISYLVRNTKQETQH